MTTQKQIESNRQNALLSTGPITDEGKATVANNAVKHGIFAKDLIIANGDGKEDPEEYEEMLSNLIQSLTPNGQMEHLLVEKISVDFWRLKRVLRFETGSIRQYLDMAIYDYYNTEGHKTNKNLDEAIAKQQEHLGWNDAYIRCLEKGIVKFDQPTWEGEGLESNIEEDYYTIFEEIGERLLDREAYQRFNAGEFGFEDMKQILAEKGCYDKDISEVLIKCLNKQNEGYKKRIYELKQQKLKNKLSEEVSIKLCSLPTDENAEKVMRYEKSLHKTILQNLITLKKLQVTE